VAAIGCCVKWVGLIMQISRVGGGSGLSIICVSIPIIPLLSYLITAAARDLKFCVPTAGYGP